MNRNQQKTRKLRWIYRESHLLNVVLSWCEPTLIERIRDVVIMHYTNLLFTYLLTYFTLHFRYIKVNH